VFHVSDAQRGGAFAGFVSGQQAQILARDLDRPFTRPGVFVADIGNFSQIAGTGNAAQAGNVQSFQLVVGNGEIDVEVAHAGIEKLRQGFRRRRLIGPGNVEDQTVREDARGARDCQLALFQQPLVEHNFAEAPAAELERL
jgi:hypothetical protein